MSESKTSVSGASNYADLGEFWDSHDLSDYWDLTHDVEMSVDLRSSSMYLALDRSVAEELRVAARDRGVSPEALVSTWLAEHRASSAK
jgi:hypothetical protein